MDHYVFIKECLKEFNYPKIHSMDDVEVTKVFSTMNRQFLVSWIFKQLDEDYNEIVEKSGKEELANLVYANGFCDLSEKDLFMNGECEHLKQMNIFFKMFKYLKNVSDSKKNVETNKSTFLKEVEDCLNFNTNLFPMYGAKQTLTLKERAKKIQDYRKEIDKIKDIISSQQQTEDKYVVDANLGNELVAAMKNLQLNFPDFKRKVLDLMKNRESVDSKKHCLGEDFSKILKTCDENVEAVLEFIENMNVITNFEQNNSVDTVDYNSKNNAIMRELAELCNEISALKKENNI